ncbi:MAG: hypothetical protein M0Z94_17760 [Dehalococcoidales bacterium]|nr:hypothetical protein [Dehalococcoidales bacterium]
MARLLSTMKLDARVQVRYRFYHVSIGLALLLGLAARQFVDPLLLPTMLPMVFLLGVGSTAMMYIAGLIIFERDQHTLDAMFVSPLRLTEYLNSKIATLTLLVLVEGTVVVLAAQGALGLNWLLLLTGAALLGIMLTLFGTILVVRFASITDFLISVTAVILPLELPAFYFTGLSDSPLWLLIPTSAPTMLIWGAWHPLAAWQLVYGLAYSALLVGVSYRWAYGAFTRYIVRRERS